ncbi:MAG: hypothetical protein V1897_03330 [Pseudomonadota bacterium]
MQYDLKVLKKEYDSQPINELVNQVKQFNAEMISRGEELIKRLFYLDKTGRYQEFDGYKKLSFDAFLWEVCHIPKNRYTMLSWAYNWYPEESRKLGPHVVQTVRERVGVSQVPKVLEEITLAVGKLKDKSKERETINKVLEKFPPVKKQKDVTDSKVYWKAKYFELEKKYKALLDENKVLTAQVERQKDSVAAYLEIKDLIGPLMKSA